MSGLALPRSQPSSSQHAHASINPSALSRPPRVAGDEVKEGKQSQSGGSAAAGGSGQASGSGSGKSEKPVLTNVPEITVVEGLVPTLQYVLSCCSFLQGSPPFLLYHLFDSEVIIRMEAGDETYIRRDVHDEGTGLDNSRRRYTDTDP